jgi:hypothetical protein
MRKSTASVFGLMLAFSGGAAVLAHAQEGAHYLNWPGKFLPQPKAISAPKSVVEPPVIETPIAVPAPVPAPVVQSSPDTYEIPATSKYAKRIANARAAQNAAPPVITMAPIANPQPAAKAAPPPVPPSPPIQVARATAPAVSAPLSAEQTDHVFIPGEQITNDATQRPRFYSLHRQYGIVPDAIDVPAGENGALLEIPFNTEEKPADDAQASDENQP